MRLLYRRTRPLKHFWYVYSCPVSSFCVHNGIPAGEESAGNLRILDEVLNIGSSTNGGSRPAVQIERLRRLVLRLLSRKRPATRFILEPVS